MTIEVCLWHSLPRRFNMEFVVMLPGVFRCCWRNVVNLVDMILARLQVEVGAAPLIVIPLFGTPCGAFSPGNVDHSIWSPAIRCSVELESRALGPARDA